MLLDRKHETGMTANEINFKVAISACQKNGQSTKVLTLSNVISMRKGLAVEAGFGADAQEAEKPDDIQCNQLQCAYFSMRNR